MKQVAHQTAVRRLKKPLHEADRGVHREDAEMVDNQADNDGGGTR